MNPPHPVRIDYEEDEALMLEAHDRLPGPRPEARSRRTWMWVLGILALGFTVYRTVMDVRHDEPLWWAALVVVPLAYGAVWFGILSPQAVRRHYRRRLQHHFQGRSRKVSAEFDEHGLTTGCEDGRSKTHPWTEVPRAVLLPDGCFVFLDDTTSFWFPKRLFASEGEFSQVEILLARRVSRLERTGS